MPGNTTLPLRDIHLPASIAWWPPAIGWWVVIGLALLLILLALWRHQRKQARRLRTEALQELIQIQSRHEQEHDDPQLIQALSIWLRRVCISHYPAVDVAGLTGTAWLQFLDQALTATASPQAFSKGPGQLLLTAPYQAASQVDSIELLSLCRMWLMALPRRRPHDHRKAP